MTREEYMHKRYIDMRNSGKCPRCGKLKDRQGYYCSECLAKQNLYQRETRKFLREQHICTVCRKVATYGDDKICFECRAKNNNNKKPLSEEQKVAYYEKTNARNKNTYIIRKEQGICTRCGLRKADNGRTKCRICLDKDSEKHRLARDVIPRNDCVSKGMCYLCKSKIDTDKKICSSCLEKSSHKDKQIIYDRRNHIWSKDNKILFGRKSKA